MLENEMAAPDEHSMKTTQISFKTKTQNELKHIDSFVELHNYYIYVLIKCLIRNSLYKFS